MQTCSGKPGQPATAPVENENESEVGPYGMKEATAKSVNTYFVQLISDIGICPVTKMAEKMGVERADGEQDRTRCPSITLGTQEMSPLTMADGYATFANRGVYCTPVAIESITDARRQERWTVPEVHVLAGDVRARPRTPSTRCCSGVVEDGTGKQAGLSGRDSAGKTGTTDERYAAWFVGLHAEPVRRRLGRRARRTERQDGRTSPSAASTTTRSSAARCPARSGGTR